MSLLQSKLYLITRVGTTGYDEYHAMIIEAPTPYHARCLAGAIAKDEGPDIWYDRTKTPCREIKLVNDGKAHLILADFNAG